MEAKELIEKIRTELVDVKKQGQDAIPIEGLERYLTTMESGVTESKEVRQQYFQRQLAAFEADHKTGLELFKATIDSGKEALNSVILINGGAVVAILSFLGSVAIKGTEQKLAGWLTLPLLQFGCGVFLGALAFGARYISQAFYGVQNKRWGNLFRNGAVILVFAAYLSFALGLGYSYLSFNWRFAQ